MPTSAKSAPTSSKKAEGHPPTHQDERDAPQRHTHHEEHPKDPHAPGAPHQQHEHPLAPEDDPYDNVPCTD